MWFSKFPTDKILVKLTCENSKYSCGCFAHVRVTLIGGNYHEDVGYGKALGHPTDTGAFEVALKSAVSDACKRALRLFGSALGNSLYDHTYRFQISKGMHRGDATPTARPASVFDDPSDISTVDPAIFESGQPTPGSLSAHMTPLRQK